MKKYSAKYKIFLLILFFIILVELATIYNEYKKPPGMYGANHDQTLGNKQDLSRFSISPGQKVSGITNVIGSLTSDYFSDKIAVMNFMDSNMIMLKHGTVAATTNPLSSPVSFAGVVDFTPFPKGLTYIEFKNNNSTGDTSNDKYILIPVVVK